MKTISEKIVNGRRRVWVELDDNETLISVRCGQFYRLGDPLGDVVPAHVIEDAMLAKWCPIAQKWEV
jgi:hypothetical protein